MFRFIGVVAAVCIVASPASAQNAVQSDRVGDTYELTLRSSRQSTASNGSSSSSNSGGALVERVVAVRPDGLELEFDLPADATPQERARDWQWPVRVLWRPDAEPQLLNTDELEDRIAKWLTAMDIPREHCGRWFFSWTAYRIECDPRSVLDTLATYDLRSPLNDAEAAANERSVTVETPIDEAEVLKEQAETDAAIAQILGDNPEALAIRAERAPVRASGKRTLVRESDETGRPTRQVETVRMETTAANGVVETITTTRTVTRRLTQAGD